MTDICLSQIKERNIQIRDRDTEGKGPHEVGGRNWSEEVANQGALRIKEVKQRQGRLSPVLL